MALVEHFRHNLQRPTFAMIAALPVECAAIEAMLDNKEQLVKNGAKYTVGLIGDHAVVVMLLTHMGNNFAAIGATKLIECFPSVEDVLMVGIAAGVPGAGNVRLGDVVVSDKGGVLQQDNVKRVEGKIEIRDTSQKPSARMLRAIRQIRTLELTEYGAVLSTRNDF